MTYIILAIVGICLLALFVRWLLRTDPKVILWAIKWLVIVAVGIGFVLLFLSGRLFSVTSLLAAALPLIIPVIIKMGRFDQQRPSPGGTSSDAMAVEEAYEVLELKPGASKQDIHQAHRRLMLKVHPDQGGSTYLAIKLNQAKDVLLKFHRS